MRLRKEILSESESYRRITWEAFRIWIIGSIGVFLFGPQDTGIFGSGFLLKLLTQINMSPFYTVLVSIGIQATIFLAAFQLVLREKIRVTIILFLLSIVLSYFVTSAYNFIVGKTIYFSVSDYLVSYLSIYLVILLKDNEFIQTMA